MINAIKQLLPVVPLLLFAGFLIAGIACILMRKLGWNKPSPHPYRIFRATYVDPVGRISCCDVSCVDEEQAVHIIRAVEDDPNLLVSVQEVTNEVSQE